MAEGEVRRTDAIVVLGCTVSLDGVPSSALSRRLDLAARAYAADLAPRVVVSGGRRWGQHLEAVVMKRELVRRGIPDEAIIMELCSLSTAENCWFTAELLGVEGARVLLATCSWHMPRAIRNFRRLGIVAEGPPAAWLATPPPTLRRRVREHVNTFLDWCMMPRAQHD